ncbi:hypothetical protein ABZ864_16990 [Streptomyces sp. NPDC047082]|uniref:hypothetical protein n=1 Tax=Streptomyces sp. NPDC047082 TaxID=3155259 RepID=UPI0033E35DB6
MLRNLDVEFRGNGLPDELYSELVRNGAVMHMKNACSPTQQDVKIATPRWAFEAAADIGAEMSDRIAAMGVRVLGDPALQSAVPEQTESGHPVSDEARISPEVAAQALHGALAAAASVPARAGSGPHGAPDVVEGTRRGTRPSVPAATAAPLRVDLLTANSRGLPGALVRTTAITRTAR